MAELRLDPGSLALISLRLITGNRGATSGDRLAERKLAPVLEDHPYGPLGDLLRELACPCRDPSPPKECSLRQTHGGSPRRPGMPRGSLGAPFLVGIEVNSHQYGRDRIRHATPLPKVATAAPEFDRRHHRVYWG